jgi:ribonuclease PH
MDALRKLQQLTNSSSTGINDYLAAVSVGIVDGVPLLDLDYSEDSAAQVDFNVVMTGRGKIVEVQGTGEESPFSREELIALLDLAEGGIQELIAIQQQLFTEDLAAKFGGQ